MSRGHLELLRIIHDYRLIADTESQQFNPTVCIVEFFWEETGVINKFREIEDIVGLTD